MKKLLALVAAIIGLTSALSAFAQTVSPVPIHGASLTSVPNGNSKLSRANTSALQISQINFSQLPSAVVNGEMFYVSDGIAGTPCTGGSINGGTGAVATGINGVWVCTAAYSPVIDVTAMGAKCDGHSDDTNPFFYAIAAAQNGGTVTTPANRVCYVSTLDMSFMAGVTLRGLGANEYQAIGGQTSGIILGAPLRGCANGTGGLFTIFHSFSIVIENEYFFVPTAGNNSDCIINVSNLSGRIYFKHDYIDATGPGNGGSPSHLLAMFLSHIQQFEVTNTGFGNTDNLSQDIYAPNDSGSFLNGLTLTGNRFAGGLAADDYHPEVEIDVPSAAVNMDNSNIFERGPNYVRIYGAADSIVGNWTGDRIAEATWVANSPYSSVDCTGASCNAACVQDPASGVTFCLDQDCTSGNSSPIWSTNKGTVTNDGSCHWYSEGRAVGFDIYSTGTTFISNQAQAGGSLGALFETSATGGIIGGNSFSRSRGGLLQVLSSDTTILSNNYLIVPGGFVPAAQSVVTIGDGTTAVNGVDLRPQHFNDVQAGNTEDWITLEPNTSGELVYDTNINPLWRLNDLSGDWNRSDPNGTAGKLQLASLQFTTPTNPGDCLEFDAFGFVHDYSDICGFLPQNKVAELPTFPEVVLSYSPGGYWKLDQSSGNFTDSSGRGNTAVVTNGGSITYSVPGLVSDSGKRAVNVTANNALATVSAAGSLPSGDTFTAIVLFKRSATQGTNQVFMSQKASGFAMQLNSINQVVFFKQNGGTIGASTATITDTSPHMLAWSKSGSNNIMMIDGVVQPISFSNLTIAPPDSTLYLLSAPGNAFLGTEDEMIVYPTALTANQLVAIYQEMTAKKYGTLRVAYDGTPNTCPALGSGSGALAYYSVSGGGQWCTLP